MRTGLIFALLLAALPVPALADVTARYEMPGGNAIVIETSDDGRGRFTPEGKDAEGGYALFTPEDSFLVFTEKGVTHALRFSDFREALDAMIKKSLAALGATDLDSPDAAPGAETPAPGAAAEKRMTASGRSEVNGRKGILYVERGVEGKAGELVISDDPALSPVGIVFAKAMLETPMLGDAFAGSPDGRKAELLALMAKGAPLRVGEIELRSVTFDKVASERFAMPGPPISRADFEKMVMERQQAPSADPANQEPSGAQGPSQP